MATDYDEPRNKEENEGRNSIEEFKGNPRGDAKAAVLELDENDTAEGFDLPGATTDEELTVQVIPLMDDEFTCMSCFLVRHRSQIAREKNGAKYCRDCEG